MREGGDRKGGEREGGWEADGKTPYYSPMSSEPEGSFI